MTDDSDDFWPMEKQRVMHDDMVKFISDQSDKFRIGIPTIINFIIQDTIYQMGAIHEKTAIGMLELMVSYMKGEIDDDEMQAKSAPLFNEFVEAFEAGMKDVRQESKVGDITQKLTEVLEILKGASTTGDMEEASKKLKEIEGVQVTEINKPDKKRKLH